MDDSPRPAVRRVLFPATPNNSEEDSLEEEMDRQCKQLRDLDTVDEFATTPVLKRGCYE